MATPKKKNPKKPGRKSKYRREYCELLMEHRRKGLTFESFGARLGCATGTLYVWADRYPEFQAARDASEPLLHDFYEKLLQSIAAGSLKRVVSEEPIVGPDGKPLYDRSGEMLMRREYAPARTNAAAAIFLAKNICKYRDRVDVQHSHNAADSVDGMDAAERRALIEKLQTERVEAERHGDE